MARHRASGSLRQGFTTGSAAAAAAKAALVFLLTGRISAAVDIPLPPGCENPGPGPHEPGEDPGQAGVSGAGRLEIAVESVRLCDGENGLAARATVVKDAGDDPDATNHARISCLARLDPSRPGRVEIEGGQGVGRVTLPGLPVAVGQAAINPVPRAQIELAAREALDQASYTGSVRLVIEVEDGEIMAARTLNPRLGIVGGISILGTQGIVKPFSLDAWKATIDSGLLVARAAGIATAAFSTGRRSERMLMARRQAWPSLAFVQAADFFAYSLTRASELGFTEIVWGCFFGKLAKMAQGLPYTHAHAGDTDFKALAELARSAGSNEDICRGVAQANTARHALEIVPEGEIRERFAALTAAAALEAARFFVGPGPRIGVCCFGFEEGILVEAYTS